MRAMIAILGGALLGCSDPLDSVSLAFHAEPLGAEELNEWSVARLESGHHRVTVRRTADAAGRCEDMDALLLRTGRDLTLRVRDPATRGEPRQPMPCGYTAVLDGLPSGRYSFRVIHSGPASRSGAQLVMHQHLHIR